MSMGADISGSQTMDRIVIKDLLVRCIVGVNEDERHEKQDVIINIALSTDLSKPGSTDRFEDALDYREMKKKIVDIVQESNFFLIEALAENVAVVCLSNSKVEEVMITVEKPAALRFAKSVGVEITRKRPG
jgi:D-erythro-7,8-dihydroneopterin triphosphate epimerase